jgi:tRNA 2-thiouridine synthesizing protein A
MELNCLGMRCPLPIIQLAKAIKVDSEIILKSDDPATLPDLTAWCRMTGNSFETIGLHTYRVRAPFEG